MKKILVVIDAQRDFITGALKNPDAQAAVPAIVKKIEDFDGDMIICTYDTHWGDNYKDTKEGKVIPRHCILDTPGWKLDKAIDKAVKSKVYMRQYPEYRTVIKSTFGSFESLPRYIYAFVKDDEFDIEFVGFCTDICVISNVLITKAAFPLQANISVDSSCCAGTTPEKHQAALDVMASCLVEIK